MSTERKQEIRRRLSLPSYLSELSALAGRPVESHELSSIATVDSLREAGVKHKGSPAGILAMPFAQMNLVELRFFIAQLVQLNSSPIFLWTSRANYCGALQSPNVSALSLDFPFKAIIDDVLVVSTTDFQDEMLFDLIQNSEGLQTLEVRIRGSNWVKASIPSEWKNIDPATYE